ncbi:MAG: hypothetical protein CML94_00550 [Rhodobiaceae bacterium]|nr:hypothetical protein [Rhodobiaceae bacterium]
MTKKLNIFFISTLLFLILGWKLNRLLLPGINTVLWDMHIYFMVLFSSLIVFMLPKKLNQSDLLIIFLILFLILSSILRLILYKTNSDEIYYLVNYLLPVFFYFWGRYLILKNEFKRIDNHIILLFIFLIIIECFNYISANFITNDLIHRNLGNELFQGSRAFTSDLNRADFPIIFNIVYRPLGISLTQYATSCLLLAMSFYLLFLSEKKFSSIFLFSIIGILLVFFYAVGTTYLIFLVAVFISIPGKKLIKLIFLPLMIIGSVVILFSKQVIKLYLFIFDFLKNISVSSDSLFYFFFGGGYTAYSAIAGEIFLLTLPFILGVFPFGILLYLLYINIFNRKNEFFNIKIFLMIIFLCSFHYNTIFMYPNSLIFFFFIGYLSSMNEKTKKFL